MTTYKVQMSRKQAMRFAREVLETGKLPPMPDTFKAGSDWERYYLKFAEFMNDGVPRFTVFVEGNDKLPFLHFGAMPVITCPGAGDCLNWCYSLSSIRYPATFFRLLQNTLLIMRQDQALTNAFMALPKDTTVRLYVDGDFGDLATLEYWMYLISQRPDLTVYGYSKSWPLFLEYDAKHGGNWPTNYFLNLSSGSIYGEAMKQRMLKLYVCRGEFVALQVPEKMPLKDKNPTAWAQWAKVLKDIGRANGYSTGFVCPGKCGTCTPKGHACGLPQFKGIPILIGIH